MPTAGTTRTPGDRATHPTVVRVYPCTLSGTVRVPGDKSGSHRALLIGALADGPCEVAGLAPSEDVGSTARVLRRLGVRIELSADADGALVGSVRGPLREAGDVLDCGNSGTTLRILAGIVAGLPGLSILTGDASLRGRPVDRIVAPLTAMGAVVHARAGDRFPPVAIVGGELRPTEYTSPVASAQVKSALLLAGVSGQVSVTVRSPLASRDHTERLLRHLGVAVEREVLDDGSEVVSLTPRQPSSGVIRVLADPSSAAVWAVAAAIADGGRIRVPAVNLNPTRTGALRVLERMGADLQIDPGDEVAGEPGGKLTVGPGELVGTSVSGGEVVDAIDELPVLAIAGARSTGGLEVHDAEELRVKESDRIATLARVLGNLGLEVEERRDGFRVPGGQRPRGGQVDAAGDHRIAMTAAVAATVADGPVEIAGFDAVSTSYPTFLDDLRALAGRVDVLAPDGT